MKTHEAKNWGELAMILTARLRLQYICTGQADARIAALLLELMQRSGEVEPMLVLAYLVSADSATGDDVLRYWTALHRRWNICESEVAELAEGFGLFEEGVTAWQE